MIEFSNVKTDKGQYIQFDVLNYLSVYLAPFDSPCLGLIFST